MNAKEKCVQISKSIICNNLGQAANGDSLYDLYEIKNGNNKILLDHIIALINIFNSAKEYLEEEVNE